jgi:hypothetical protein
MKSVNAFVRTRFRLSFRRWQPLDPPYQVTQSMLQDTFSLHKDKLEQYIYLGWNKHKVSESRRKKPLFMVATGKTRREARQNFKEVKTCCWPITAPAPTKSND